MAHSKCSVIVVMCLLLCNLSLHLPDRSDLFTFLLPAFRPAVLLPSNPSCFPSKTKQPHHFFFQVFSSSQWWNQSLKRSRENLEGDWYLLLSKGYCSFCFNCHLYDDGQSSVKFDLKCNSIYMFFLNQFISKESCVNIKSHKLIIVFYD